MSNNDINESNIFKELSWDLDFWDIKEESKKLFFILVYLKTYPTYDLLTYMFDS